MGEADRGERTKPLIRQSERSDSRTGARMTAELRAERFGIPGRCRKDPVTAERRRGQAEQLRALALALEMTVQWNLKTTCRKGRRLPTKGASSPLQGTFKGLEMSFEMGNVDRLLGQSRTEGTGMDKISEQTY